MEDLEFARLVDRMRVAQREYFRTRSSGALADSRALEKRVDERLRERLAQPSLFGRLAGDLADGTKVPGPEREG